MSKNPRDRKNSQSDSFEGTREDSTRVDLGDDLLEKTVTLTRDVPARFDIEDQLQSAKILMGEGFSEEAKKILRKILVLDPHHVVARQSLEKIHESELQQLFGDQPKRRTLRRDETFEAPLSDADAEEIMRELDRDLKLGIFADQSMSREQSAAAALFGDTEAMEFYADRLDSELAGNSGQDRMDLGVAFLEMGLHDLSLRQFRAASHVFMQNPEQNAEQILSATALVAHTLILVGRPYEATMTIQSILRDAEIKRENKLEFLYLMGRAYESMRKPELAKGWFDQVAKINPNYRDVGARLRRKR